MIGDRDMSGRRYTGNFFVLDRTGLEGIVTNQPPLQVFVTGNDHLTIIGYRLSLPSLLRLSL